jgi:hypothetical protein
VKLLHTLRGSVWLVMTLLLVCGAVALHPPHVRAATAYQDQPLVSHVLRYNLSEASEVAMIWGVNGWHMLPEAQRPLGTIIIKTTSEVMQTPMKRVNGLFEVTLQAPAGATINYIFHITRTRSGISADVWDLNGVPERDFHTVVVANGVTDVTPTISLGQELLVNTADVSSQWVAALILLGMTLLIGIVTLRFHARDPFLDY